MTTVRSDTHWVRIKAIFGFAVISFVAYLIAAVVQGVPEEGFTFQTYPVVTSFAAIFVITLICGAPAVCYLISKDQTELSKDYPDTTQRHWITIGIFSYFSIALYPFWYFFCRHRKVKRNESTDEHPSADGGLAANIILSIIRATSRFGVWLIGSVIGLLANFGNDSGTNGSSSKTSSQVKAKEDVTAGDEYLTSDSYENAIRAYELAIESYEQLLIETTEEDTVTAIKNELDETRDKLSKARALKEEYTHIRSSLRDAENYFQTALAEHARREYTPAKRDYRQARDKFEDALSALTEADEDLATDGGITVSVQIQGEPLPESLADWPRMPDQTVDILRKEGIGNLTELDDAREDTLNNFRTHDEFEDELVDRLKAAKRYQGEGERTFSTRTSVERRKEAAQSGQKDLT